MSRIGTSPRVVDDLEHPRPLVAREIDTGRVVAARVQHDDRAGGELFERSGHPGEVEAMGRGVVVGIGVDRKPRSLEQRPVVLPARIADPHLGIRIHPAEEVRSDLQRAGAPQPLNGDGATLLDDRRVGAERELLDCPVVRRNTVDRQITSRRDRLQHVALDVPDALEHRDLPLIVVVDADAQVHLLRVLVGGIGFGDAEDWIAGRQFDAGEDRCGHVRVRELSRRQILPVRSAARCRRAGLL